MRSVLWVWVIAWSVLLAGGQACVQRNERQQSYETVFYPSGKLKIEAYVFKPEGASWICQRRRSVSTAVTVTTK